jgi:hypothetical protein
MEPSTSSRPRDTRFATSTSGAQTRAAVKASAHVEVPVDLVDLLHARTHEPGELEQLTSRGDAERRIVVPQRVRDAVLDARGAERRPPVLGPEAVQVEVAALDAREQKRRIQAWGRASTASRTRWRSGTALRDRIVLPYSFTLSSV